MKQEANGDDHRFDRLLHELGPLIPNPQLREETKAVLMPGPRERSQPRASAVPTRSVRRVNWVAGAGASLAAILALSCLLLWSSLARSRTLAAQLQWNADEALSLLMIARQSQELIPVPQDLGELRGSDLVLMTFHHELCPLARTCTPRFHELMLQHADVGVRFKLFDVTGDNRAAVNREIEELDYAFALAGPPGAETGVVKVIDTKQRRIVCSAPAERGIAQACEVLTRVRE